MTTVPSPSSSPDAPPPGRWHPDAVGAAADYSGRSNLAFAFLCLPREKRADMNVFYTFCRVVDDIADAPGHPTADKQRQLAAWQEAVGRMGAPAGAALTPGSPDSTPVAPGRVRLVDQLATLVGKYRLPREHLLEIIAGCEMDLHRRSYATFEELRLYCHRVASAVGLVSIEIFGYQPGHAEACRHYARDLGLALQLTNIIRDVEADLDNDGRVYLPLEDLHRFHLSVDELRARRAGDERVRALLEHQAERAETFYQQARAALPPEDRPTMLAAEIMGAVYQRLLDKMRRDGFRVFRRRYRLSHWAKLWTMGRLLAATWADRRRGLPGPGSGREVA